MSTDPLLIMLWFFWLVGEILTGQQMSKLRDRITELERGK